MIRFNDPKKRPISSESMYEFLKDDPARYEVISDLCILAAEGISKETKDAARAGLDAFMGSPTDILIVKDKFQRDIYIDNNFDEWKYVGTLFDFYRVFMDSSGEVNYVFIN